MVNLAFRFPGGRYHATPWGNHVNEGLVEWPPSPWRIVRALLATGFSKLGWREPPTEARELVDALASELPEYRLPEAIVSHTRHFMPTDSRRPEDRTKVFDAFAHVGEEAELVVTWRVHLSTTANALLREIVPKISYLGRAESIVVARIVDDVEIPPGVLASATDVNRPGVEPVALLAPMSSSAYAKWYCDAAPPSNLKKGGKRSNQASPFPDDSFAALLVDTAFLQEHGWTQPPGSRRIHYYRPPLATAPRRIVSSGHTVIRADTALIALSSDTRRGEVLPLLTRALPQAEILHMGLVSQIGNDSCPELTGRGPDGLRLEGNRHAGFIPLDVDADGQLDHFLLYAPMGFGVVAQRALRAIKKTYAKGAKSPLFVTLAGMGVRDDFVRLGSKALRELAEARVWTSETPFVPPRHLKLRRHTLVDQVQAELAARSLPRAARIDVLDAETVIARGFHRFVRERGDRNRKPPAPRFFGLRIELEQPARGPITLGYGAYFGLGLFVPEAS